MAFRSCDIAMNQVGNHRALDITEAGTTLTRDVRVCWEDTSYGWEVIECLKTVEEALQNRMRAEGMCAANS